MTIQDVTETYATLGLMGVDTKQIAHDICGSWLNDIAYFRHASGDLAGISVMAGRLSYVGAPGWEITCHKDDAKALYRALKEAGCHPVGAFAQSSMRIEKRFLSYGHDIDTDSSPEQLGLMFAVDLQTPCKGLSAIIDRQNEPPLKTLVTIIFDQTDVYPIGNEPVLDMSGQIIGKTTSASFGYRIGVPVALALIQKDQAIDGNHVHIDIAGQLANGRVSLRPAFDPDGKMMRPSP